MVQPSRGLIDGPNSGTLMLMLLPGLPVGGAALTGTGLAADGVHILSFGWNLTPPLEGYAWLFPKAGTPPGEMTGEIQNAISMTVSNSSTVSVCWAADHKYKLSPKG
jgi:hypothetical protein